MAYRLNAEEKYMAKELITGFVGWVLEKNSDGDIDIEKRGTYNLLENYVNGFHNEEMVYREITAKFKNHVTALIGENRARTERLKEKIPYVLAASVIPLFVPSLTPLALMAFMVGPAVLMKRDKKDMIQIIEARKRYNLVDSLGCRQGAKTVKSLMLIIAGG